MAKKKWGIGILFLCTALLAGCGGKDSSYKTGLRQYESGAYAEAVASFQAAIAENNTEPRYYIGQGMAYIELDDFEDAFKSFDYALGLDDKSKLAYRGKGIAYLESGDYDKSLEAFQQALQCADGHVSKVEFDILKYRGEAETAMGNYDAAAETYSILLDVEKKPVDNYYLRGNVYALKGDIEAAKADFDALVKAKPNDYAVYCCVYQSLSRAGAQEEAKAYLDEALLISGGKKVSNKYRGMVQYLLGEYQGAVTELTAIQEPDAETLICLGMCYEKLGDQESAFNVYTQALEIGNENAGVYNQVGLYELRSESYPEALDYFRKGLELQDPQYMELLCLNEVAAYEYNGDFQTARDKLEDYIQAYGSSPEIERELTFLRSR